MGMLSYPLINWYGVKGVSTKHGSILSQRTIEFSTLFMPEGNGGCVHGGDVTVSDVPNTGCFRKCTIDGGVTHYK